MVDNACLRVALTNGHPDLGKLGLSDFRATVEASERSGNREGFALRLNASTSARVLGPLHSQAPDFLIATFMNFRLCYLRP